MESYDMCYFSVRVLSLSTLFVKFIHVTMHQFFLLPYFFLLSFTILLRYTLCKWNMLKALTRVHVYANLFHSCPTLSNTMDCSPPGSCIQYSVFQNLLYGILQARTLEWVAMTSSRGSFQPRD